MSVFSYLTRLLQIIFENRFKTDIGNDCLMSVDGTDFRVPEHGRRFFSYKFKKSGLRYEVGLCIRTGDIVWINGPYECGLWNDLMIFRNSLLSHLEPNERIEADDGYVGEHPQKVKCPKGFTNLPEKEKCNNVSVVVRKQSTRGSSFGAASPRHFDTSSTSMRTFSELLPSSASLQSTTANNYFRLTTKTSA